MRMTEEEYKAMMDERVVPHLHLKKKSKYGNKWVTVDGIKFQSQKEANRYCELKLLKQSGEVINFIRQVPFDLPGRVKYFLDFMVWWRALPMCGQPKITYEDVKGYATDVYKTKKKIIEATYPIKIEEK